PAISTTEASPSRKICDRTNKSGRNTARPKQENPMFRIVGWLVVTGFALYGLGRFVDEHVTAEKQ
ncbi:MAG TPA: hypothetical protein PLX84_13445, partial [Acidiphilium sp.]|nr:hypothetical protein [Acidiphilium sp.]